MEHEDSPAIITHNSVGAECAELKVSIILVHGTWARGFFPSRSNRSRSDKPGRWFEEESKFRVILERYLANYSIHPQYEYLEWSGSNSIFEREVAAKSLADYLRVNRSKIGNRRQIVIGHSHGGNVILRSVQHIGECEQYPLLVTIATPFIEVVKIGLSDYEKGISKTILGSILALPLLIGGFMPMSRLVYDYLFPGHYEFPRDLFTLLVPIYFTAIAVALLLRATTNATNKLLDRCVLESSHSQFKFSKANLLVIRGVDDEASLALGVGSIANKLSVIAIGLLRVPSALFMILALPLRLVVFIAVAIYIAASVISNDAQLSIVQMCIDFYSSYRDNIWVVTKFCLALIGIITITFVASFSLVPFFKALFGRELLLTGLNCEINSHSVPDSSEGISVVTLHRRRRKMALRHGLYDEDVCAETVARWLALQLQRTKRQDEPAFGVPNSSQPRS